LEYVLNEKGVKEEPGIPDSLEDHGALAEANLSGSIVLHNRAIRAAKKPWSKTFPWSTTHFWH
jgi:hypothetical protein